MANFECGMMKLVPSQLEKKSSSVVLCVLFRSLRRGNEDRRQFVCLLPQSLEGDVGDSLQFAEQLKPVGRLVGFLLYNRDL